MANIITREAIVTLGNAGIGGPQGSTALDILTDGDLVGGSGVIYPMGDNIYITFTFPEEKSIGSIKVWVYFAGRNLSLYADNVMVESITNTPSALWSPTWTGTATILKIMSNEAINEIEIKDNAISLIPFVINTDTLRRVYTSAAINTDTNRKIAGELPYLKNITINIAPKTLSDSFDLTTIKAMKSYDRYVGAINDFNVEIIIKKVTKKMNNLGLFHNYSCTARYDIDDLLNNYIYFTQDVPFDGGIKTITTLKFSTASSLINFIAGSLGKKLNIRFADWVLGDDTFSGHTTMQSVVSQLFGWTDKVPNRLVNVFLRGDTIHVLQRGLELSVMPIIKYENVTITEERLKLLKNSVTSYMLGKQLDTADNPIYKSGVFTEGDITKIYSSGLVTQESHTTGNTLITTKYEYHNPYPPTAYTKKTTTISASELDDPTSKIIVTYEVNDNLEIIKEIEIHYDASDAEIKSETLITRHSAMGQGEWVTIVEDVNGVQLSSSISKGAPSGKATAYEIEKDSLKDKNAKYQIIPVPGVLKDYLGTLPTSSDSFINSVISSVMVLNGKTEERVSMDVKDYSILDFTKRYTWRGNEYYLEKNSVAGTSEKIIQKVELVRWY